MATPTSVNPPLQLRAGRNIGIEPGLVPFVQDGAGAVGSHLDVSLFFSSGGILSYPNKLKYKMVANAQAALPTARVLVKSALIEYDQPSDEV